MNPVTYMKHDEHCECQLCAKVKPHGPGGRAWTDGEKDALFLCLVVILTVLISLVVLQ
jgi:hypothetical protein